jgi:cupin superfamily acireductone dioxygenase involved in methionine salvage
MQEISAERAKEFGIITKHESMDNGEMRFRLQSSDGSSYIKTVAKTEGGWENSHYHTSLTEIAIVQAGWIVIAQYIDNKLKLTKIEKDNYFICKPNICHNTYLSANASTHTVKYGGTDKPDWIACPELDEITHKIKEEELLKL